MVRNLIVLPDGTEIFSGEGTVNAIQKVTLTQRVNEGNELTLGSVCVGVMEADLITPQGNLHIQPETELMLYKVDPAVGRILAGIFVVESAKRIGRHHYRIKACDRLQRLDRDLTQWLEGLDGWPYRLDVFAKMVCNACNLTLVNKYLTNGEWKIQKFTASDITGRQLMKWVGQACGQFCRATADGNVELAWYRYTGIYITPDIYFMDTLQAEDYQTAYIDRVQIRQTQSDIGVSAGEGSNTYVITGNRLLSGGVPEMLQMVAENIFSPLMSLSYTPCTVTVPASLHIEAGDEITLTDGNGKTFPVLVMTKVQCDSRDTLRCVGSARRDSIVSSGGGEFDALSGKVLELEMGVNGLVVKNRDNDEKITQLQLTTDGLKTRVTDQQKGLDDVAKRVSTVEQTAEGLSVQVRTVLDDGVSRVSTTAGYTFDETGMTVEKSGRAIKTQITEDGMRVYKNENIVLTASSEGVEAVDLHASTYLIVGGRSRFENYGTDRTGCFWIGE